MSRRDVVQLVVHGGALVFLIPPASIANVPDFQPTFRSYAVGVYPSELVAAHLDGDGLLDLVVGSWSHVKVMKALDNGLYQVEPLSTGSLQRSTAVSDFNEDGLPDVAVANGAAESLDIFLGDGAGFVPGGAVPGLDGAYAVRSADFNEDGHADVAVTNGLSGGMVGVALGRGDGTFDTAVLYPAGNTPQDMEIADLNGDDVPDLVVGNAITGVPAVSIYLGAGGGTFVSSPQVLSGSQCYQLAVADFDGDTIQDIVVTNDLIHAWTYRRGRGDGTFDDPVVHPAGETPQEIAAGDVDEDGFHDIVYLNWNDYRGKLLCGNGDGTFQPARLIPLREGVDALLLADMDDDAHLDLVVGGINQAAVLFGDGAGGFQAPNNTITGDRPASVAMGLLNADAYPDMVVAHTTAPVSSKRISVYPGNGTGGFGAPVAYNGSATEEMFCRDMTGDGRMDIVSANGGSVRVEILPGTASGFGTMLTLATPGSPKSLALADLNQDGRTDIVVGSQGAWVGVLLAQSGGTFAPSVAYATNTGSVAVAVGDLNGDGYPDVAATNGSSGELSIFPGNGTGTLGARSDITGILHATDIEVHDFNRDGAPDIAVVVRNDLWVYLNHGGGTFDPPAIYGLGEFPRSLRFADMNEDDFLDAVTANANGSTISVRTGDGNGRFLWHYQFAVGPNPWSVALSDLDGDGRTDAVAGSKAGTGVAVLLNRTEVSTSAVADLSNAGSGLVLRPNPARGSVTIEFVLAESGHADLSVFDIRGGLVTHAEAQWPAGANGWTWNPGPTLATGVYYFLLETAAGRASGRLVLSR